MPSPCAARVEAGVGGGVGGAVDSSSSRVGAGQELADFGGRRLVRTSSGNVAGRVSSPLAVRSPVSSSLLAGLVLDVVAIAAFVVLVHTAQWSYPRDHVLVLLFTAGPAVGNALAAWGVQDRGAPAVRRLAQVAFAVAAL